MTTPNPTAHDEMMRMLDECARLGKENVSLRQLAIAIEADSTEPEHRREWARELLTANAKLTGSPGISGESVLDAGLGVAVPPAPTFEQGEQA